MTGLDTNILVAHAIPEHHAHGKVRKRLNQFQLEGHRLAVTSGILAEFIHVITDPKRFESPLTMIEALEWAAFWSAAEEVTIISTEIAAHRQWLEWLEQHRFDRKRLLDTLIAATWWSAGIRGIFTLNPADFKVFRCLKNHHLPPIMTDPETLRRGRLVLGSEPAASLGISLSTEDSRMDETLEAPYDAGGRRGGLGGSNPKVACGLGDIRRYFPSEVVQVMQKDAIDRLDLKQLHNFFPGT